MANKYELLYTLAAKYTDEEVSAVKEKITAELVKLGLSISRNEEIGKIKLGYPMKHVRHGHYVLVVFEAEPSMLTKVTEYLRLHNEILRHQITHFDPAVKPIGQLADPEVRIDYRATEPTAAPVIGTAPAAPVEAMTPEELDKRLEALEEDITKSL